MDRPVVIHIPAAPTILSASSTLTDRTNSQSIATNYDYTQYVPPTCSELYGLANVNETFDEECQDDELAQQPTPVNNNKSKKNSAVVTQKLDTTKGVAKGVQSVPSIAESSAARETIEAGPSSKRGLKCVKPNTYYVVVDDYKSNEDGGKSKMALFQRARLARTKIVGKRNKKRGVKNAVNDNEDTPKKISFFGRLKGKGKQNSKQSAKKDVLASPEAWVYLPSMLTPTSSPPPDVCNATPSGLNPINSVKLSNLPPKMPSAYDSISASMMWKTTGDDNASNTDVTHASDSSRGSPTNSPLRNNNNETDAVVASDKNDAASSAENGDDDRIGKGTLDSDEVVACVDGEKSAEKAASNEGRKSESSMEGIKTEVLSKDEPLMKVFIDPLVSKNENEIEMEYLGVSLSVMIHEEGDNISPDPVPLSNVQESTYKSSVLSTEPVVLEDKSSKCDDPVSKVSSQKVEKSSSEKEMSIDISTPNNGVSDKPDEAKNKETQNECNQTKHTTPQRCLTLTLELCCVGRLHNPASENEAATDKVGLTKEDVVESTPAIEAKPYYEPNFCVRTKHANDEELKDTAQPQESKDVLSSESATKSVTGSADGNEEETVEVDPSLKNTSQPVKLSKLIAIQNKRCTKEVINVTSFDDTLFDGVTLAGTNVEEGTSSSTFISGDSTFHSENTELAEGCGLIHDLNDVVEDFKRMVGRGRK